MEIFSIIFMIVVIVCLIANIYYLTKLKKNQLEQIIINEKIFDSIQQTLNMYKNNNESFDNYVKKLVNILENNNIKLVEGLKQINDSLIKSVNID